MNAHTAAVIINVALFLLIGFLCWLFNHWWPVVLILTAFRSQGGELKW